ncbi:CBS domain-containing protein [Rhodobacteraceae bacterium N5(2021)]|uniref:CBS domain-containing protein n=1 Tax=Gymnodinialimonas phycosphaerae TaxID=2841589 RepID=A0A975TSL5_9RHOB|nr:CBS domain-containing protein [Gymnodinialimonas phycosphaerae]MBY4893867.1 CBS domain-containing protein [Gymnodinialimonas phycosphaerae]
MTTLSLVSDHMARHLVTLSPDQEINNAMHVLLKHGVSGAPVVDGEARLVGILTEKDCLRAALEASYYRDWGKPVSAYMQRDVATIEPDIDILAACQTLLDGPYRRFPVVDDGRLVGLISRTDVLRALADTWGMSG